MSYQEFLEKTRALFLKEKASIHIQVETQGVNTIYRIQKNVVGFYYSDRRQDKAIENLIVAFKEVLEGNQFNTIFKLHFHPSLDLVTKANFMEDWVSAFEMVPASQKLHLFSSCYKHINPYLLIKVAYRGSNQGEIISYVLNQSKIEGDNPREGTVYDTIVALKTHVPNFIYLKELKIFLNNHQDVLEKENLSTVNEIYREIKHFVKIEDWQDISQHLPGLFTRDNKKSYVAIGKSSYHSEVFSVFHKPVMEKNITIASDNDLVSMVESICVKINQKNKEQFLPDLLNVGIAGQLAGETLIAVTYHNHEVVAKIQYLIEHGIVLYNNLMRNKTRKEEIIEILNKALDTFALEYDLPQKEGNQVKWVKI